MENRLATKKYIPPKILLWFFAIYAVFTMACYMLPYTQFVLPYTIMAPLMLFSFVWMFFGGEESIGYSTIVIVASLMMMFAVIIAQRLDLVTGINTAIRDMRFFLPVLWGVFALKYANEKQRKIILVVFVALILLVVSKTIEAVRVEPMIVRLLAQDKTRGNTEINAYRLNNVAGYTFSYMMGAVVICAAWIASNSYGKLLKGVGIVVLVLSFFFVIETMYATLLILSFLGIVLVLFVKSKNIITKVVIIFFGLIAVILMEDIMEGLSNLFAFSDVLHIKFRDMHNAIKYGDISQVGSRPQLIFEALGKWAKSPLFGSSEVNRAHSTVFSILQESGIVGLSLWIAALCYAIRIIKKRLQSKNIDTRMFGVCAAYVGILSIFNDIRSIYELTIVVFFIVPVLSVYITENMEKSKNFSLRRKRHAK